MTGPVFAVRAVKRFPDFVLDVAFETGATTLLSGPSGSGKSLLLGIIAGTVPADSGWAILDGETLFDQTTGHAVPPGRRALGCVFQDARLFPHLSVRANLEYGLRRAAGRPRRFDVAQVVDVLGLSALLGRRTRHLSGGEAQRVAIGRALLSQPRALLFDEPLSALDRARRGEVLSLIERVREAFPTPMIYASHDAEELDRLGGDLVRLNAGELDAVEAAAPGRNRPSVLTGVLEALDLEGAAALGLRAGSHVIPVAAPGLTAGARAEMDVAPRDVVLCLELQGATSAQAAAPGEVLGVSHGPGELLVTLSTPFGDLRALVPHAAGPRLGLEPGRRLWALVARMSKPRLTTPAPAQAPATVEAGEERCGRRA